MGNKKTTMNTKLVALPCEIIVDIISRLPLKLIIQCKFLSKTLNDLISGPSFSQIYLTNNTSSFCTINLDCSNVYDSLDLVEFDQKGNHETVQLLNAERLRGGSSRSFKSICIGGYCNGLICVLILESGVCKPFVMNPILSEFIELPEEVDCGNDKSILFSYGLGHCQLSNRYKVLRVITVDLSDGTRKTHSEIYTIGYDQTWRNVSDVNVPHNMKSEIALESVMFPLRSALHWFVYPVASQLSNTLEPFWKHQMNICAFDMTEEKVSRIQLPQKVLTPFPYRIHCLNVVSDKLCFAVGFPNLVDFWVMDEYGVEGSWTKKLVLKKTTLPCDSRSFNLKPLIVLPEGVILISDWYKTFFYDTKKEICLREIHHTNLDSYPILFVPNFVSLRNFVQPSGVNDRCSVRSCLCSFW